MDYSQMVASAITGALSGGAISLIAPFINWGVEKKRELRKSRQELLAALREMLADPPDRSAFARSPAYFQVRQYLRPATIQDIEGTSTDGHPVITIIDSGPYAGLNQYAHQVLADLAALEKKWRLL